MKNNSVLYDLKKASSAEKAKILQRFFKTGIGEYGYGDVFLGVTVPVQREIARKHLNADLVEISELLDSEYHEARLTGLLILVMLYENKNSSEPDRLIIVNLYKEKMNRINNWDLVDLTAHKILGHYYFLKNHDYLHKLSKSKNLWETRIGVISTYYFIKQNQFNDTLKICESLLSHKHDLIHKATGWMLREIGKKDLKPLRNFLEKNVKLMPRTMLRYAIEKLPEVERRTWLKK